MPGLTDIGARCLAKEVTCAIPVEAANGAGISTAFLEAVIVSNIPQALALARPVR